MHSRLTRNSSQQGYCGCNEGRREMRDEGAVALIRATARPLGSSRSPSRLSKNSLIFDSKNSLIFPALVGRGIAA